MSENRSNAYPNPGSEQNNNPYQRRGPQNDAQWNPYGEPNAHWSPGSGSQPPSSPQTSGYAPPTGGPGMPPYYQAPQYAQPGKATTPPQEKTLSNSVAFVAFGAMLIAAALGLAIALTGYGNAGRGLLVGVGLCALIAAGVLGYAALKGQRPGWFLAVSIVGAVLAVPVTLGAAATVSYDVHVNSSPSSVEFSVGGRGPIDDDFPDFGPGSSLWENMGPVETFTSDITDPVAVDTYAAVDLTDLEPGINEDYFIYAEDSYVRVFLRQDQLPSIFAVDVSDSLISVSKGDFGLFGIPRAAMAGSSSAGPIEVGFLVDEFGLTEDNAANLLNIEITSHDSFVEIVFVDDQASDDNRGPGTVQTPQSGTSEDDQE